MLNLTGTAGTKTLYASATTTAHYAATKLEVLFTVRVEAANGNTDAASMITLGNDNPRYFHVAREGTTWQVKITTQKTNGSLSTAYHTISAGTLTAGVIYQFLMMYDSSLGSLQMKLYKRQGMAWLLLSESTHPDSGAGTFFDDSPRSAYIRGSGYAGVNHSVGAFAYTVGDTIHTLTQWTQYLTGVSTLADLDALVAFTGCYEFDDVLHETTYMNDQTGSLHFPALASPTAGAAATIDHSDVTAPVLDTHVVPAAGSSIILGWTEAGNVPVWASQTFSNYTIGGTHNTLTVTSAVVSSNTTVTLGFSGGVIYESAIDTPVLTITVRSVIDSAEYPNGNDVITAHVLTNNSTQPLDIVSPTVTINREASQFSPTPNATINYTVVFSESVADFATGDVTLTGTAGATTATVTGSGTTYNVAVTGMTGPGTVIATIAAHVCHDAADNPNAASTSTGNDNTVRYDTTVPAPQWSFRAGGNCRVATTFVPCTDGQNVCRWLTDQNAAIYVARDRVSEQPHYHTGGQNGLPYLEFWYGLVDDRWGRFLHNDAWTDGGGADDWDCEYWLVIDPHVRTDKAKPFHYHLYPSLLTGCSSPHADDTGVVTGAVETVMAATVNACQVIRMVCNNTAGTMQLWRDGVLLGTAAFAQTGLRDHIVFGGDEIFLTHFFDGLIYEARRYSAILSDAQAAVVLASVRATYGLTDVTNPTVTVNQAASQADPINASPILFEAVFSEPVTMITPDTPGVLLSGTAGATTAVVTEIAPFDGTTYRVTVSGMTGPGTVIVDIDSGYWMDAAENTNDASTSTDHTVTYDATGPTVTINQASGQADPTCTSPINFTVVFSESVSDFATGDVNFTGSTAPGTLVGTVTGSGTTYNVAVSGMTGSGTVIASIAAHVCHDALDNPNAASTSTDHTVAYDVTAPVATVTAANVTETASTYLFNIQWDDPSGMDYTTIAAQANIQIVKVGGGSNGNCLCTAWGWNPNPTGIAAQYTVTLAHAWTAADNGTWNIIHVDETETQVADSLGNKVALGAVLESFTVNIAAGSTGKKSRTPMTLAALQAAGVLKL